MTRRTVVERYWRRAGIVLAWALCSAIGHVGWIYTAGGGFCPRCARDGSKW